MFLSLRKVSDIFFSALNSVPTALQFCTSTECTEYSELLTFRWVSGMGWLQGLEARVSTKGLVSRVSSKGQ